MRRKALRVPTDLPVLGGIVAVLAFAMALAGLAGALGRMVVERRRELAIRAALGATPARTMRLVLGDAAIVVGGGIAAGTAGALAGAGVLRSVLYGVGPRDATTLAAVAGTVALVSLALCAVPARRAAASDPMDVLRDV